MGRYVKIDIDKIERKFSPQQFNRVRRTLGEAIIRDSSPYVPFKGGTLEGSDHITSDGKYISWNTPYANAQYKGRVGKRGAPVRRYSKAGTGKLWVQKARRANIGKWRGIVERGL